MKPYIGTKLIQAQPGVAPCQCGEWPAGTPGYEVRYEDGYTSWSPSAVFEKAYRPTDGLSFGLAYDVMRLGGRVALASWAATGEYLWLMPAAEIKAEWCREPHLKALAEMHGGLHGHATVRKILADGSMITGWVPSQEEMASYSWYILPPF